jgi:hypothetical protein
MGLNWLASTGLPCYRNKNPRENMTQEPQKKKTEGGAAPETAEPSKPEEPTQVIKPEDEAIVAERLRQLGYIE